MSDSVTMASIREAREAYHLSCAYLDHSSSGRGVWEIDPDEYPLRLDTDTLGTRRQSFLPPTPAACQYILVDWPDGRRVYELALPLVEDDVRRVMHITHSVVDGLRMFCHPDADDLDRFTHILDFAYARVKHPPYPKMMSWGGVGRFGLGREY